MAPSAWMRRAGAARNHRPRLLSGLLWAAFIATPLNAQPDITVTGQPAQKEAVRTMTRAISRTHDRQLARFESEVCFVVKGLVPPYDAIMRDRMAQDAAAAGVPVGRPGCAPNVVVIMADNLLRELQRLSREKSGLVLAALSGKDLKTVLQEEGPVHVVTATELRTSDGNRPHLSTLMQNDAPQYDIHEVSMLHPSTRQDIESVLVLMENSATMGKSLQQLGDYAALRALADVKDDHVAPTPPTILSLFQGPGAPAGMTDYDRAYLAGLYRGSPAMTADAKMHEITQTVMSPPRK
jgi:hypothetical protein